MAKTRFWADRSVFVTGANGFVGSWLTKALVDDGAQVVVLVRDVTPKGGLFLHGLQDKVTIVFGDITDRGLLERVLNEQEIDAVFHLAAQVIVQIANRSPLSTFESNIRGTWNLLEACKQSESVKRVVVASSDKAYGDHAQLPYTEDFTLQGVYPYEASKTCADLLTRSYAQTYGLPVAVTRCANIFGGGDLNFSRIIPDTMRSLFQLERPPVIRSDGSPIRDYMYVKDAVSGYLTLAERIEQDGIRGEAFNFGTEQPTSVLDLVRKLITASPRPQVEPEIIGKGNPDGEIERQYLSAQKAREYLKWGPEYGLDGGVNETVSWYEEYFDDERLV